MHGIARLGLAIPLIALVTASGLSQPAGEPLELSAKRALAEARVAEAQLARLQKAADEAKGEVERLRAQQAASAEAITAAEARISAADANARAISAQIEARRDRLRREQAPATALLGGLAVMAERPPLLAILDQGSTREFVRVRLLLDSTLPAIRARTASLRAELERGRSLQQQAELARTDLVRSRNAAHRAAAGFREPRSQSSEDRRAARRRGARRRRHRARSRRGSRTAGGRSSASAAQRARSPPSWRGSPRPPRGPARPRVAKAAHPSPTSSRRRPRSSTAWVRSLRTESVRAA